MTTGDCWTLWLVRTEGFQAKYHVELNLVRMSPLCGLQGHITS